MRRRHLLAMLGGTAAAWPACAQQPIREVPRIGFLGGVRNEQLFEAFTEGLRETGYIDGQNLVMETRFYGTVDRADEFARELVALKCSVIFAPNPYAIRAMTKVTDSIPIVGVDLEDDPVSSKWGQSLARPGRNVTGVFLDIPELGGKLIEFLRDAVPTLSHLAVIWDETIGTVQFGATAAAAHTAGVKLESLPIRHAEEIEKAFESAARERSDGLVVLSSPLVFNQLSRIAELALRNRLPTISLFTTFPRAGGLIAYGPNLASMWKRAASYISRILAGTGPSDLPIERPSKFELGVNLKTATVLGLTIPQAILIIADDIID